MENKYTNTIKILPGDVDYQNLLAYPEIFSLFQDIAVTHSEMFGYDQSVLTPKGLFWVTAKYRVKIYKRPAVSEFVEISTWPKEPDRIRGRRNYTIDKNGERMIEATSEWAIIDRNVNRLYMLNKLYEPDFEFNQEEVLAEPFYRFTSEFSVEPFGEYRVRSIDIDYEGHMNNVNYLRAMFGLFSRAELEQMNIHEIECQYKVSCYEGDRLLWYKNQNEDSLELCAKLEDGTIIFLARIS